MLKSRLTRPIARETQVRLSTSREQFPKAGGRSQHAPLTETDPFSWEVADGSLGMDRRFNWRDSVGPVDV